MTRVIRKVVLSCNCPTAVLENTPEPCQQTENGVPAPRDEDLAADKGRHHGCNLHTSIIN